MWPAPSSKILKMARGPKSLATLGVNEAKEAATKETYHEPIGLDRNGRGVGNQVDERRLGRILRTSFRSGSTDVVRSEGKGET